MVTCSYHLWPINPITKPNPVYSHSYMWQYGEEQYHLSVLGGSTKQLHVFTAKQHQYRKEMAFVLQKRIQEEWAIIWILRANVHLPGTTKKHCLCIMRSIHWVQIFTRKKKIVARLCNGSGQSHIRPSQCNWNQCHSAVRGSKGLKRLFGKCLCVMFPQHSVWLVPVSALGTPHIHKMQQLTPDQNDRHTQHWGVTSNAPEVWFKPK
jgi:hypothetical protein